MPTVATTPAQVIDAFGGPERFRSEDRPIPTPGPGQIQIKVAAAAVNPVDLQTRSGKVLLPQAAHFPMVLGWDAAGSIHRIGDGVVGWQVDERVAAMSVQPADQNGTYAGYINLAADLVVRVPDGLDLEHAATIPLTGLTASQLVRWLNLPSGSTLVVNGPAGAVGRFVVQLASRAGIKVIAVAKRDDRDEVIELGATEVVGRGDFAEAVRDLHPGGVDAAIDVVGGAATGAALASVRDGGACVTVYSDYDHPTNKLRAERDVRIENLVVHPDTADLARLLAAAGRGELTTLIARTYPLSEAAEAHRRQAQGGLHGKLVLLP